MHDHHHHDHHDQSSSRIGWAFFLNFGFTIIEFIGGWLTNSTAIMADAVHDLGDTLAIGSAWLLQKMGAKKASNTFTYGYKRLSLLGALINGVVLITGSVWILAEAIPRLSSPEMPMAEGMFLFAIFGMAVNGFAAYKLSKGETLNERILNWHLIEDVLGWFAVLIVSVVLMFVEWPILDPILSIAFTLFILFNVAKNLVVTVKLFLQGVPSEKISQNIAQQLKSIPEIKDIHHVHFWSLDGEKHVLTAHVELKEITDVSTLITLKACILEKLKDFDLAHTTIEFEFPDELCRDNSEARKH